MDAGAETLNSAKNLEGCCIQSMMSVYSGSYELVHFVTCWNHRCSATGARWSINPWKWANVHSLFNLVKNKSQSWLKHMSCKRAKDQRQQNRMVEDVMSMFEVCWLLHDVNSCFALIDSLYSEQDEVQHLIRCSVITDQSTETYHCRNNSYSTFETFGLLSL